MTTTKNSLSMHFNSSTLLWSVMRNRDRAKEFIAGKPDVPSHEVIPVIVLATASTEAFINEFSYVLSKHQEFNWLDGKEKLQAAGACLDLLEEEHGALALKFAVASHLLGKPFDKGKNPYQDFASLVKIRNDVMHMKALEAPSKYLEPFQNMGRAYRLAFNPLNPTGAWLAALMTENMAAWACDTAFNIIRAIIDAAADENVTATFAAFDRDAMEKFQPTP